VADKKTGAAPAASFKPENLTKEQQEAVVEFYLGCHPKYFIYEGVQVVKVDLYKMVMDGYEFSNFKGSVTA